MDLQTKSIVIKRFFLSLLLLASVATPLQALADCNGTSEQYLTFIVTYYETESTYDPAAPTNSLCTRIHRDGQTFCRIRLRGTLYYPKPTPGEPIPPVAPKFPAILVNHGSGANFEAYNKACEIANYFVPKGYIVFVPFRRGYGDENPPSPNNKSTGIYMEDFVADFVSANPSYNHQTNCAAGDGGCYRAELFEQEARAEVADFALNYLKNRSDVKKDAQGLPVVAIMGNSYGGAVTVLANEVSAVHRVAIGFSVASQQWELADCPPNDQTCGKAVQRRLLTAAGNAKKPAFYLQAKWDYDTRPTIDLAYAHAYGGSDHQHGQRFMASIFPYQNPCPDRQCIREDYQKVHTGFFDDTHRWGPYVLEFMRDYGVK
jgi:pimeloyl-ACP methyl ester carboxylesterase